jgi:hypothetical protein
MHPLIYCVDLDRTLISQDSTRELLKVASRRNPRIVWKMIASISRNQWSGFKSTLATIENLDSVEWKVRPNVESDLLKAKGNGVSIYLVTASQTEVADYFYEKYNYFEGFVSSDRNNKVKGASKLKKMELLFGVGQFEYLGDSIHDLHIWKRLGNAKVPRQKRMLILYLQLFYRNINIQII